MGETKNHLYLTWEEMQNDVRKLAHKIRSAHEEYAGALVITRGGLGVASVVVSELHIKLIETFCVESYAATAGTSAQNALKILKGLNPAFIHATRGKTILVIDEVCDSGRTMRLVRKELVLDNVLHLVAVPYVKPEGKGLVDTWVREVPQDTWIHFPWDPEIHEEPSLSVVMRSG